jgi:flagellar basal-body rod protein FlgB
MTENPPVTEMPSLMRLATQAARHAASRQAVIATNVANADTPGYRARDIPPFDPQNDAMVLRRSDPRHLAGASDGPSARVMQDARIDPNGNSVSLQDEVLRSVEVSRAHSRALAVYGASLDLMRASLGRR